MIEETAQILEVHGDAVEIVTQRHSACGSCSAKAGCGTSLIAAWFPQRQLRMRLQNTIGARKGDSVVVGLDEALLQRGAMRLYALPLAGLLVGAVAGDRVAPLFGIHAELGAVLLGLLGLTATLFVARHISAGAPAGAGLGVKLLRVAHRSTFTAPDTVTLPTGKPAQAYRKHE